MNVDCESNTIHQRAQLEGVFSRYSWTLISLHPSSPIFVCIAENLMGRVRLSLCLPHCQLLIESVRRFFAGGNPAQKPPLSHSIYIFRLLRQFPMLSIWWGYKVRQVVFFFFFTRFIFHLTPHNHWLEAYFNFQYLEILVIEIESLAVRGCERVWEGVWTVCLDFQARLTQIFTLTPLKSWDELLSSEINQFQAAGKCKVSEK